MPEILHLFLLMSLAYAVTCSFKFVMERRARSLNAKDSAIAAIVHGVLALGALYVPVIPAVAAIIGQALAAAGSLFTWGWAVRIGTLLTTPLRREAV